MRPRIQAWVSWCWSFQDRQRVVFSLCDHVQLSSSLGLLLWKESERVGLIS